MVQKRTESVRFFRDKRNLLSNSVSSPRASIWCLVLLFSTLNCKISHEIFLLQLFISDQKIIDRWLVEAVQGIALSSRIPSVVYLNFIEFRHTSSNMFETCRIVSNRIIDKSGHVCRIVSNCIIIL